MGALLALLFIMSQIVSVNRISEHSLFLRLFITNGGGW
jgi:hypothetical protein